MWSDAVSRREAWLSAGAVFAIALVVRAVAAAAVSFPVPEDTAYYAGVARNLVEGRGLISDSLWSYGTQPLAVPRAAFEVWMPLPSLLAAIPMAILGAANWFRAAQVASVLVSSAIPVLAWRFGADVAAELGLPVGRARALAVGSGLVAAGLGPLVIYGALPDSTALFAALSLAACLLMTRIAARDGARRNARRGCGLDTPLDRSRSAPRPGRPDPQRGHLARSDMGRDGLAVDSRQPTPPAHPDRDPRHRCRARLRPVGGAQCPRLRNAAAGADHLQRPLRPRLRRLRLSEPAEPGRLPGPGSGRSS